MLWRILLSQMLRSRTVQEQLDDLVEQAGALHDRAESEQVNLESAIATLAEKVAESKAVQAAVRRFMERV